MPYMSRAFQCKWHYVALRYFTINAQGTKTEKFDRFPARKITRNNLKLTGRVGVGIWNWVGTQGTGNL